MASTGTYIQIYKLTKWIQDDKKGNIPAPHEFKFSRSLSASFIHFKMCCIQTGRKIK